MVEKDYWIKRSAGISAIGTSLVVMTTGKGGQRQRWGEYFIFISGRHPKFCNQRTNVDTKNIPENVITLDLAFMKQELEMQVRGRLSVHFFDLYEETKSEVYLQKTELEGGQPADIIGLWLRGEFHDEIRQVKGMTQCDSLKDLITTVVDLPSFQLIS